MSNLYRTVSDASNAIANIIEEKGENSALYDLETIFANSFDYDTKNNSWKKIVSDDELWEIVEKNVII